MIIKKYSFCFEVISVLKISTFAAKLIILSPLLQFLTLTLEILKLKGNNFYFATEIEKEQKICLFGTSYYPEFNFLRRCEYIERKTSSKIF